MKIKSIRTYSLDPLSSNRAFGTISSLLCALVNQLSSYIKSIKFHHYNQKKKTKIKSNQWLILKDYTWSFDNTVLVGFGGIAKPCTVDQTLHHFRPFWVFEVWWNYSTTKFWRMEEANGKPYLVSFILLTLDLTVPMRSRYTV